jgi:hypothetical protein
VTQFFIKVRARNRQKRNGLCHQNKGRSSQQTTRVVIGLIKKVLQSLFYFKLACSPTASTMTEPVARSVSLRPPTLPGVDGVETDNGDLTRAVHHQSKGNRPENTSDAYDPKVREFKGYCDALYPHHGAEIRHLVTPDKVYNFLFYQSHREKRKPGRLKKGQVPEGKFSMTGYRTVVGRYAGKSASEWLPPSNPVQIQQVNTYKSSLMGLHKEQVANKANKYVWTHHIWTCHCEELYKLVKARRNKMKKANYVEKVDETFSFFKASGKAEELENAVWLKATDRGLRAAYPAIR